jgi:hypothetical protein
MAPVPGILESVTPETVADQLKSAGYRVTHDTDRDGELLLSATQGLTFAVRFGSKASNGGYLDFSFNCVFSGAPPITDTLLQEWHRGTRFCRLWQRDGMLVLEMDVLVAGGVTAANLRSWIMLWDRLVQALFIKLRAPQASSAA